MSLLIFLFRCLALLFFMLHPTLFGLQGYETPLQLLWWTQAPGLLKNHPPRPEGEDRQGVWRNLLLV